MSETAEIDDTDWLDDGELTGEEKALIDARLDECERNPTSFVPWDEAKARINDSLKRLDNRNAHYSS